MEALGRDVVTKPGLPTEPSAFAAGSTVREHRLVAGIRAGDVRAFEELYELYRPRLDRFLTNLVRRPQLVEEIFSDTMIVVWKGLEGFNGTSKLSTWIFAISYRQAMKTLRRNDEPVEAVDTDNPSPDLDPEQSLGRESINQALRKAIADLSDDHRTVVDLTYYHELGYRDIAEIMECPVDTVKTRMFHARRILKRKLAGEGTDWF